MIAPVSPSQPITEGAYLELFAKLDAAREPSRALDAEIDGVLRIGKTNLPPWAWKNFSQWRGRPDGRTEVMHLNGDGGLNWVSQSFTSSVDVALQLLRPHYLWQLKQGIECTAIVWWLEKDWNDTGAPTAYSTTYPALALTKAALLARAVEDRFVVLGEARTPSNPPTTGIIRCFRPMTTNSLTT